MKVTYLHSFPQFHFAIRSGFFVSYYLFKYLLDIGLSLKLEINKMHYNANALAGLLNIDVMYRTLAIITRSGFETADFETLVIVRNAIVYSLSLRCYLAVRHSLGVQVILCQKH